MKVIYSTTSRLGGTGFSNTLPTPHPKLRIAQVRTADGVWLDALLKWTGSGEMLSEQEVKQGLKKWVPEYCSSKNS